MSVTLAKAKTTYRIRCQWNVGYGLSWDRGNLAEAEALAAKMASETYNDKGVARNYRTWIETVTR